MDAYWHRFESGYIIRVSATVASKCMEDKQLDITKLVAHYKSILEIVLKKHDKVKDNYHNYLQLCNTDNFSLLDREYLVIKIHTTYTPLQLKIIDSIFNALTVYNKWYRIQIYFTSTQITPVIIIIIITESLHPFVCLLQK